MVRKHSAQDVNATVDGNEDRGATQRDLAEEVSQTGGPVAPHEDVVRRGEASKEARASGTAHEFEGAERGANSDDQYDGPTDEESVRHEN